MTSERRGACGSKASRKAALRVGIVVLASVTALTGAAAAEASYPFEGSWVAANRACAADSPHMRVYTAHEVTSRAGHCNFRKIASGSGQFEIFEECRRADRPEQYTETIRMLGPDAMQVRRQAGRLKIARGLRYTRCSVAPSAPRASSPPPPLHKGTPPIPEGSSHPVEPAKP